MESQDKVFAQLAHHPPQKLKDSSYFNYYNSMMADSNYLSEKQNQQANLSKSTNNFKILCDRNFINTSQYHRYQKFGNNQHQRDMLLRQQKKQQEEKMRAIEQHEKQNADSQKQDRLQKIKTKQSITLNYSEACIYKKVIDCKKIKKPVTLSFSSINVHIYEELKSGEKQTRKMVKKASATFDQLNKILYHNTQEIINYIQNQVETNIKANDVKGDINFNMKLAHNTCDKSLDSYFVSYKKMRFRHDDKVYEMHIVFPYVSIFVVEESYRQKIRISRKWIKSLLNNYFQEEFDSYTNMFNVKKMQREIRNSQLKFQSKKSWDLAVFKNNTVLMKTLTNDDEVVDEIHIQK